MPIVTIGPNNADDFDGIEDTFLNLEDPTGNNDGAGDVSIGKYAVGAVANGIFRFLGLSNITGPVIVNEVRLYGNIEFMGVNPGHTISARRLLRNVNFGQATWNQYSSGNNWGTAGGNNATDRVDAISGDLVLSGSESGYVYLTGAGMGDDVQAWINGDLTNLGWILERTDGANDETYFAFTASTVGNPDGSLPYLYVDYDEDTGGGGDMAAVMSFGLAVAGHLDGRGALSGTRAMLIAVAGNIDGRGRLATTAALTFAVSASMDGAGRVATTIPAAFSVSGALDASGRLATTMPSLFALAGNLDGRAPMTLATTSTFAMSGTLQGTAEGFITATLSASFAVSGALDASGRLATTMPSLFALAGNLDGRAPMTAGVSIAFGLTGDLEGTAPGFMTFDADLAFEVEGVLRANGSLRTTAPLTFQVSGGPRGAGDLFGATAAASFDLVGDLTDLPDISEMVGNMEVAFGWLAQLVNSGQGEPIPATATMWRVKSQLVPMTAAAYLDRYFNYAKTDATTVTVRVTFSDGVRFDLPVAQYRSLYAAERTSIEKAGVSVRVVDNRLY